MGFPIRNKKEFSGGLNGDSSLVSVAPNQFINGRNIRYGSSDRGGNDTVQSIGGTTLIFDGLPPLSPMGHNYNQGSCEDEAGGRILFFNYNTGGGHGIYCLDKKVGITYTVLLDHDVIGGLGFSKDSYIHSCFFINNNLYWVDGTNNEPRRINVESGIKAYQPSYQTNFVPYVLPVSQSVIAWIRRPPGLPPTQFKDTQGSPYPGANFIQYASLQFCYRYQYRDYELSTLSSYSTIANYNDDNDTFNKILVTIPPQERIEQDVLVVDLVARYVDTDTYKVIKSWDKTIPQDALDIANHNAGILPLEFAFYNNTVGITLGDAYKVKPYDSVPIYAQTAERAKNRTFMGNYIIGYNTPTRSSLTSSFTSTLIDAGSIGDPTGTWYYFFFQAQIPTFLPPPNPPFIAHSFYVAVLQTTIRLSADTPLAPVYYYKMPDIYLPNPLVNPFLGNPIYPQTPFPSSLPQADVGAFMGSDIPSMVTYVQNAYDGQQHTTQNISLRAYATPNTSTVILSAPPTSDVIAQCFKSGSSYQLSITFYDNYQRKCGVFVPPPDISLVNVPDTGLVSNLYVTFLTWFLDNTNALLEIPEFAYYYSINITKCLTTRFFLQNIGIATYASKDPITGVYDFTHVNYSNSFAGVAIDLSNLLSFKMGYTFTQGDILKVIIAGVEYQLAVESQIGSYAVCELQNLGTLDLVTARKFEIYTPYQRQANEPFYEVANIFPVTRPRTDLRQYSILTGTIGGDAYLLSRTIQSSSFTAEAMSPNDKFWQQWNTSAGRPNFIDTIGQTTNIHSLAYSNTLLNGTKVNGLSTYEALNVAEMPFENGAIRRLILAQKIEEKGNIMLGICEKETCSIYIGEVQVVSNTGSSFIATSDGIIGTINPLKGSFGTLHPESAFEYNGLVFWFDVLNGAFIQYANNGLDPVSRFGMIQNTQLLALALQKLTNIQIEQLGSRPFVIGGVDPYHKEAVWSIPATTGVPFNGFLPDYGSPYKPYPYQLYDGSESTWVYKFERNQWMGGRSFYAEGLCRSGNDLFGFKFGELWKFNDPTPTNQNTFFGVYQDSQIAYLENSEPSKVKTCENISVEANMKPVWAHLLTNYPYIQGTDLVADDFQFREGVWYATVLRDRLSPNTTGTFDEKLVKGDKLRAASFLILLEFDVTQQQLNINFVNDGYELSVGHNT